MPTTTSRLSLPEAKWVMLKAERLVKSFGEAQAEIEELSASLAGSTNEVVPDTELSKTESREFG